MNKKKAEKKLRNKLDKEWREQVKAIYNNKCAICGETKMLNAHHIIPKEIKEFRWDIDNAIALCPKHHRFGFKISAHQNPLIFLLLFEKLYPERYNAIIIKAKDILQNISYSI
jgi:5-methylcytosine-specific restriction endonuclease McrA